MRSINYKPGWWAVYFVYCMIPIAIYVRYLYKSAKEPNDEDNEEVNRANLNRFYARNLVLNVHRNRIYIKKKKK